MYRGSDILFQRFERCSGELFGLTYGVFVAQMLADFEVSELSVYKL